MQNVIFGLLALIGPIGGWTAAPGAHLWELQAHLALGTLTCWPGPARPGVVNPAAADQTESSKCRHRAPITTAVMPPHVLMCRSVESHCIADIFLVGNSCLELRSRVFCHIDLCLLALAKLCCLGGSQLVQSCYPKIFNSVLLGVCCLCFCLATETTLKQNKHNAT